MKDEMSFFLRWPVTETFRNRIRRVRPTEHSTRKLKMSMLETERLVLREFHQDDLRDVVSWEQPSSVQHTEGEAQEFLDFCFRAYRESGIGPWGLLLKKTGAMVGNCGFYNISFEDLTGEVNYYVAPQLRGQGLAPEALNAVLGYGFEELGLSRIPKKWG